VFGCLAVALCEGFDLQAAGVAAGGIVQELHPPADQLGTFFSASTLGLFAGALLGGRLSDSFGRKRTMVWAIALFGASSLLTATAPSINSLIGARLLTGLGLGAVFPNLLALVMECSPVQRRGTNVVLAYSGMPFGGAVASFVSLIGGPGHWRVIFLVGGVVPLILSPALYFLLHESSEFEQSKHRPQADRPAAPDHALKRGSFLAIMGDGRALSTTLLWVCSFLELLILYLILSWLPLLLVGSGFTRSQAAGVQIFFNVGGGLAALGFGQLLAGAARNPSIIVTFIAVPLFVFLLSRAPPELIAVTLIVFGLGGAVLAAQSFIYATAPPLYPTLIRGVGVGAAVAAGRLGSVIGPKLGGALNAAGHGSAELFGHVLPLVALASIAGLWLAWRVRIPSAKAFEAPQ
jgi:AAHS family 3-hydroxyphenylpropionic acid transporter